MLNAYGPPTSNAFTRAQQSRNRQVWVEALRSGRYQAPGVESAPSSSLFRLVTQNGLKLYSAMGVLTEMSQLGEWQSLTDEHHIGVRYYEDHCTGEIVWLGGGGLQYQAFYYLAPGLFSERSIPQSVMDWVGLLDPRGSYKRQGKSPSRIMRMASVGPLEEVAEIIETQPRGLFDIPDAKPFPMTPEELEKYRMRSRASHIAKKFRASVLEGADYTYFYCGQKCVPNLMEIDHYVPLSLGGSTEVENLRASCKPCNARKRNRMPVPELLESLKREAIANLENEKSQAVKILEYEERFHGRVRLRNSNSLSRFYLSDTT